MNTVSISELMYCLCNLYYKGKTNWPGSVKTSLAAAISMNIFSALALSSPSYLSGCHLAANFLYAFNISFFLAVLYDINVK